MSEAIAALDAGGMALADDVAGAFEAHDNRIARGVFRETSSPQMSPSTTVSPTRGGDEHTGPA